MPVVRKQAEAHNDTLLWRARAQCAVRAVARTRTRFSPSTWQRAHGPVHGQHMMSKSLQSEPSMLFIWRIFPRAGPVHIAAWFRACQASLVSSGGV
jgi:hypothetical protein